MDAEIRKLAYTSRSNGAKTGSGLPRGIELCFGELPLFLRKESGAKLPAKTHDIGLETRLVELERERAEEERRHRETLVAVRENAAHELAAALDEQKERLTRECTGSVHAAIGAFKQKQDQYFAEAEEAVVRLALSVAARVLHREAQLDPLMLRGPVRVALEDAQQNAVCVLEVSAADAVAWSEWLAKSELPARVDLRTRDDAAPGHCRLEIGASSADMSVYAQLAEIERGFFDLLQTRSSTLSSEAKVER